MTIDEGDVGVTILPKNDDVIYEQPLIRVLQKITFLSKDSLGLICFGKVYLKLHFKCYYFQVQVTCFIYFPIIFYIVNGPNEKIYKFCKTQPLINSISTSLTNASCLASRQLQQDLGGTVTQTIASDKIFYNSMFWAIFCRIVTQNIYL